MWSHDAHCANTHDLRMNNKFLFSAKWWTVYNWSDGILDINWKLKFCHTLFYQRKVQFPPYQECLVNLDSISAHTLCEHTCSTNYSQNSKFLFLAKWWTVYNSSEECERMFGYLKCLLKHCDLTEHRVQLNQVNIQFTSGWDRDWYLWVVWVTKH